MRHRLFTSISKAIIGFFCIAAPWIAADIYLRTVNAHSIALALLREELNHNLLGSKVFIGDCTVAPMRYLTDSNLWKSDVRIMSFGGSGIKEWYYLLFNNREKFEKADQIVIASLSPLNFTYLFASYISFLPYLMTEQQIFDYYYREQKISFSEAIRFSISKAMESYPNSQEFRFRTMNALIPGYHTWHEQRMALIQKRITWRIDERQDWAKDINTSTNPSEYMHRIAAISPSLKSRLTLVVNARAKYMRNEIFFEQLKIWLSNCKEFDIRCIDMTETMPDDAFEGGDGMHLMNSSAIVVYGIKLEEKIQSLLTKDRQERPTTSGGKKLQ